MFHEPPLYPPQQCSRVSWIKKIVCSLADLLISDFSGSPAHKKRQQRSNAVTRNVHHAMPTTQCPPRTPALHLALSTFHFPTPLTARPQSPFRQLPVSFDHHHPPKPPITTSHHTLFLLTSHDSTIYSPRRFPLKQSSPQYPQHRYLILIQTHTFIQSYTMSHSNTQEVVSADQFKTAKDSVCVQYNTNIIYVV